VSFLFNGFTFLTKRPGFARIVENRLGKKQLTHS
jgi:hypothetical protein